MFGHSSRLDVRGIRSRKNELITTLAPALLLLLLSAAAAGAQVVNGRVVGDSENEVIRGALVTLLSSDGTPVRSVLTNTSGAFRIQVDQPGSYRLRAEMIGRKTVQTDAFDVGGEATMHVIALASQPIQLDGLTVNAASRCASTQEAGEATLRVWDEVRKALRSQSVASEMAMYEFAIERRKRTLDPRTRQVLDESKIHGKAVAPRPFTTLGPAELAEDGYARKEGSDTRLYGPNSEVLLSPEFEETHCFSLKEGKDGRVGLVFKPVSGRKVTDIEGVLWIDGSTAELQRLEFNYKRLPSGLMFGPYSGLIEFQRLEGGAWIIGRWQLTTPVTQEEAEVSALEPLHTRDWAVEAERHFNEWVGCAPAAQSGAEVNGNGNGQSAEAVAECRKQQMRRFRRP
jgi:hypothetical protein